MNIEAMARECVDVETDARGRVTYVADLYGMERFAALVRAQALEEAARVCEGRARDHWDHEGPALACADAIRALAATMPGLDTRQGVDHATPAE